MIIMIVIILFDRDTTRVWIGLRRTIVAWASDDGPQIGTFPVPQWQWDDGTPYGM